MVQSPKVAVDVVIFTIDAGELKALLVEVKSGPFAGHWALRGYGMWVAEEVETGRFVGRVGLHYPEGWPGREVGWALAREFWGRGLAYEAARAAIRHAFEELGWQEVISLVHPGNQRSIELALRLGERFQGSVEIRGLPHNLYRLGRTA